MRLPTVRGRNLLRQQKEFPADFQGDRNLVFIAFQQWQQSQVDTWVPLAEQLSQQLPHFHYYEFPTIQRLNAIARTFINEGMRAGIRDEPTRARTVTLYLDKDAFCQALNIPNEDDIEVVLFDRSGHVLWRARGGFTPEKAAALQSALAPAST